LNSIENTGYFMAKNKLKVSDVMKEFGISQKEALHELTDMGVDVKSVKSSISEDVVDLVKEHFQALRDERSKAKAESKASSPEVHLKSPIVVKNLADILDKKANEIVSALMSMNILASINQKIDEDIAIKICDKFGFKLVVDRRGKGEQISEEEETVAPEDIGFEDKQEDLISKPPVVTFLGHVDHGKTSLQDKVRKTNIVSGESGGITQHIGASTVTVHGKQITFVDTPGHEAFTAMRARGANVTDIAILVVAADDGFMPQTVEALNHVRAAGVPIIVAINKMDLPGANPERILTQMQQNELMSEDWGGEVGVCRVSAETGEGIDELLDRIILESEMQELKANPKRPAEAIVLESQVEQGLGSTANILIMNGTLRKGDTILCGEFFGKVRVMIDEHGNQVDEASPSFPVKLVGLPGAPEAGAKLICCENDKALRKVASLRADVNRTSSLERKTVSLDDLFATIEDEKKNRLPVIIKADVKGSVEAILDSLNKFPSEKIIIDAILTGIGAITENDVMLAAASGAILLGFHVRVNPGVNDLAKNENVEIRLYSVIYELLEDIEEALTGRLAPDEREKETGWAKILEIFSTSKGPNVIGCMVESGTVRVGAKARVYRNNDLIFNGSVNSLRRFKDDVKEVKAGLECGIRLDNFADFIEGDKVQLYEVEYKKASL
jgi:translation initiation factor IF-2